MLCSFSEIFREGPGLNLSISSFEEYPYLLVSQVLSFLEFFKCTAGDALLRIESHQHIIDLVLFALGASRSLNALLNEVLAVKTGILRYRVQECDRVKEPLLDLLLGLDEHIVRWAVPSRTPWSDNPLGDRPLAAEYLSPVTLFASMPLLAIQDAEIKYCVPQMIPDPPADVPFVLSRFEVFIFQISPFAFAEKACVPFGIHHEIILMGEGI